jgi:hypothetical protein
MLRAFAQGKDGYLFSTRSGRPPSGTATSPGQVESAPTRFDAFGSKHYAGPEFLKT